MSQFKTVLYGAQFFTFTTRGGTLLELHGNLVSWTDRLAIRIANHEYLKRDGGECEPMGAAQGRWSFRCCLIGPDLALLYRNIQNTIRKEPRGQMVHPRLGNVRVACEGLHSQEAPENAIDVLEFSIDFVEDAVDTAISDDVNVGPSVRARQVADALSLATSAVSTIVTERIANEIYTAVTSAMNAFTTMGNRFQETALAAADAGLPDLTLGTLLERVATKRDEAIVALNKVLTKTLEADVSLVDARTAVYVAYAACVQLLQAVLASLPGLVKYTVPTAQPLTTVLVNVYGSDARARRQDVYRYNRIPTPYWIPGGTVLQLIAPKVRQ